MKSTYTRTIHGCAGFLLPFPNACSFSTGGLSLLSCCSLPCTVLLPHGPQQPPFTVPSELPFFPRLASVSPAVLCQPPLLLVSSAPLHTGSLYPHGSTQLEKSTWWGVQGDVTPICILALASVLPCAFSQQHSCLTVATSLFEPPTHTCALQMAWPHSSQVNRSSASVIKPVCVLCLFSKCGLVSPVFKNCGHTHPPTQTLLPLSVPLSVLLSLSFFSVLCCICFRSITPPKLLLLRSRMVILSLILMGSA